MIVNVILFSTNILNDDLYNTRDKALEEKVSFNSDQETGPRSHILTQMADLNSRSVIFQKIREIT